MARRRMMLQLISSGALQDAHANPVQEVRLAWELAGNMLASQEVGQREDHPDPLVPEERPSLEARVGPPELERARQRQELQNYLQLMDPTDVKDMLGQDQHSTGPLMFHFVPSARSTDRPNPDKARDLQQNIDLGADAEPAQDQQHEQDFHWTAELEATGSTRVDTVSNISISKATIEDVARRTRATAGASQCGSHARPKGTLHERYPSSLFEGSSIGYHAPSWPSTGAISIRTAFFPRVAVGDDQTPVASLFFHFRGGGVGLW